MMDARIIKDLERKGFMLDLPAYDNNESIITILQSGNERLFTAIPLLLLEGFDYDSIIKRSGRKKEFDRIITIASKIYSKEGIKNTLNPKDIKLPISEFNYYLDNFRESIRRRQEIADKETRDLSDHRNKIGLNESLSILFSPAKIRIMRKIFNHEKLSNTDLKYYYRSIRPLIQATLNEDMKEYLKVVDKTKKKSE